MSNKTVHDLPFRSPLLTDEFEVQSAGGGASARVLASDFLNLGLAVVGPPGPQGQVGFSGYSGFSGFSGLSGMSGNSGYSGKSGFSSFSGYSGVSGFSGISGYSGVGLSGYSGLGLSGYSGFSSFSGYSGMSGYSGAIILGGLSIGDISLNNLSAIPEGPQKIVFAPDTNPMGWNIGAGRCTADLEFISNSYFVNNPDGHVAIGTRAYQPLLDRAVEGQGIWMGNLAGYPPSGANFAPMMGIETWFNQINVQAGVTSIYPELQIQIGQTYYIVSIGTTDFTLMGAASNTVGLAFVATNIGTGTGTCTLHIRPSGNYLFKNSVSSSNNLLSDGQRYRLILETTKVDSGPRYVRYRLYEWVPNTLPSNIEIADNWRLNVDTGDVLDINDLINPGQDLTRTGFFAGHVFPGRGVTSITSVGTTATVVLPVANVTLFNGEMVTIDGAIQADYNGYFAITVVDDFTFTYTMLSAPGIPATGSLIYAPAWSIDFSNIKVTWGPPGEAFPDLTFKQSIADSVSGYSGISGYSGTGISGFSGYSGIGTSGYSGVDGFSGYSGIGTAGFSVTSSSAPTIASATTITPTTPIVFVSGILNIDTITPPTQISTTGGSITIIPTGGFATTMAGNIALNTTAIVGQALIMTYDATTTKWYPSY